MRGEIDFAASLHERVATLAGLPETVLADVLAAVELYPRRPRARRRAARAGAGPSASSPAASSRSSRPLAAPLGITLTRANALEVVDGRAHGPRPRARRRPRGEGARAARVRRQAVGIPMERTIAIGDGANDLDMLAAAGLRHRVQRQAAGVRGRRRRGARPARRGARAAGLRAVTAFVPGTDLARALLRRRAAHAGRPRPGAHGGARRPGLGRARARRRDVDRPRLGTSAAGAAVPRRPRRPRRRPARGAAPPAASRGRRLDHPRRPAGRGRRAGPGGRRPRPVPVDHRIEISTLEALLRRLLGPVDLRTAADWLVVPQQRLLALTAGAVSPRRPRARAPSARALVLPARRLAVSAGRGLGGDRAGRAPGPARRDGRRRPGVAARHRPGVPHRGRSWRCCRSAGTRLTTSGWGPPWPGRVRPHRWHGDGARRSRHDGWLRTGRRRAGRRLVELLRRHNALGLTAPVPERTDRVPRATVRGGRRRGDRPSPAARRRHDPEVREIWSSDRSSAGRPGQRRAPISPADLGQHPGAARLY